MSKEMNRVRRMALNLIKKQVGYHAVPGVLSGLTDKQLAKIRTQRDVVKAGIVNLNLQEYLDVKAEEKAKKAASKKAKAHKAKNTPQSNVQSTPVTHGTITFGEQENIMMERIMQLIQDGLDYHGEYSKKPDGRSGYILVNASAARLERIMLDAQSKHTNKEIIDSLIKEYGSIQAVYRQIKRFIRAIYDDVYATWAGGGPVYEADLRIFANTVGGVDLG